MRSERVVERGERALQVAPHGEQSRPAASRDRDRPRPVEFPGPLLPWNEPPLGLVELADRDQRLERVRQL